MTNLGQSDSVSCRILNIRYKTLIGSEQWELTNKLKLGVNGVSLSCGLAEIPHVQKRYRMKCDSGGGWTLGKSKHQQEELCHCPDGDSNVTLRERQYRP